MIQKQMVKNKKTLFLGEVKDFSLNIDNNIDEKKFKLNSPKMNYKFNATFDDCKFDINDFIEVEKNKFDLNGEIITVYPKNWFTKLLWRFINVKLSSTKIKLTNVK